MGKCSPTTSWAHDLTWINGQRYEASHREKGGSATPRNLVYPGPEDLSSE
jgi:hypothetical protein